MTNDEIINRIKELEEQLKNVKGTECLIYSRVVGFFSPTKNWNKGKLSEWEDRVEYTNMNDLKPQKASKF